MAPARSLDLRLRDSSTNIHRSDSSMHTLATNSNIQYCTSISTRALVRSKIVLSCRCHDVNYDEKWREPPVWRTTGEIKTESANLRRDASGARYEKDPGQDGLMRVTNTRWPVHIVVRIGVTNVSKVHSSRYWWPSLALRKGTAGRASQPPTPTPAPGCGEATTLVGGRPTATPLRRRRRPTTHPDQ